MHRQDKDFFVNPNGCPVSGEGRPVFPKGGAAFPKGGPFFQKGTRFPENWSSLNPPFKKPCPEFGKQGPSFGKPGTPFWKQGHSISKILADQKKGPLGPFKKNLDNPLGNRVFLLGDRRCPSFGFLKVLGQKSPFCLHGKSYNIP